VPTDRQTHECELTASEACLDAALKNGENINAESKKEGVFQKKKIYIHDDDDDDEPSVLSSRSHTLNRPSLPMEMTIPFDG
jgi:hypothetical protein